MWADREKSVSLAVSLFSLVVAATALYFSQLKPAVIQITTQQRIGLFGMEDGDHRISIWLAISNLGARPIAITDLRVSLDDSGEYQPRYVDGPAEYEYRGGVSVPKGVSHREFSPFGLKGGEQYSGVFMFKPSSSTKLISGSHRMSLLAYSGSEIVAVTTFELHLSSEDTETVKNRFRVSSEHLWFPITEIKKYGWYSSAFFTTLILLVAVAIYFIRARNKHYARPQVFE